MVLLISPSQRTKTPELVPEDAEPVWSGESKTTSMKRKVSSISNRISDSLGDPRIGPALLLGALLYSGTIWWARSQPTGLDQSSQQSQSDTTVSDCFTYYGLRKHEGIICCTL